MWDKYTIEKDKTYHWNLGKTAIWVRKIDKEWFIWNKNINQTYNQSTLEYDSEPPEGVELHRIISDKNMLLSILPALPDRSVVVKPSGTFKLLPNMNIQLYIHIPLWIQFYHGSSKKENLIFEHPSIRLSSTWFGEPDNGVLAYLNSGGLFTSLENNKVNHYEAICPVKIINDSSTNLNFQRLLLNVESISIYSENHLLFTSEIKVRFKGENIVSDIQYANTAPSFLKNARLLAPARNSERINVLRKSFHFIKSLTDY